MFGSRNTRMEIKIEDRYPFNGYHMEKIMCLREKKRKSKRTNKKMKLRGF